MPDTQQELKRPLLNESMSREKLICPNDYVTILKWVYKLSQNVTDSAVQKENYEYLGSGQERKNSDFRGQEVTLVPIFLIPQKAIKRLILNTKVSLDYKAHVLDTWIQNPNTLKNINSFLPLLYNMIHLRL